MSIEIPNIKTNNSSSIESLHPKLGIGYKKKVKYEIEANEYTSEILLVDKQIHINKLSELTNKLNRIKKKYLTIIDNDEKELTTIVEKLIKTRKNKLILDEIGIINIKITKNKDKLQNRTKDILDQIELINIEIKKLNEIHETLLKVNSELMMYTI